MNLMTLLGARQLMEIGGGRWPLFCAEDNLPVDVHYVVSDISGRELSLAPNHVEKICIDIAQKPEVHAPELYGQIDLMFSRMVFEHVADTHQAYKNIHLLLAPGGVCLNLHPVLYSPPFLVNRVLPEALSSRLLRAFYPRRHGDDLPKFPARYDHCVVSQRERAALMAIGYRRVWQVPFWYHDYFKRIPGLYHLDWAVATFADRRNWARLASYCYTLVMK